MLQAFAVEKTDRGWISSLLILGGILAIAAIMLLLRAS
jgi:hypothetical protein